MGRRVASSRLTPRRGLGRGHRRKRDRGRRTSGCCPSRRRWPADADRARSPTRCRRSWRRCPRRRPRRRTRAVTARDGLAARAPCGGPLGTGKRGGASPTVVPAPRRADRTGVPRRSKPQAACSCARDRVPTSTFAVRPARPRFPTPTTASGVMPMSSTWMPLVGPPSSPGRTGGSPSTADRRYLGPVRPRRGAVDGRAGVDLYGDSEIAESYRHGDRPAARPHIDDGLAR